MAIRIAGVLGLVVAIIVYAAHTSACSLCDPNAGVPTMREDAANAKFIVFGTLSNPRLNPAAAGSAADGSATDFAIERILKSDPFLNGKRTLTLPRYVPVDAKAPPKFLVFCDINAGKLDPYRGCPATPAIVDYVQGSLALDVVDRAKSLGYFVRFLDHADPEIAGDAFREFARASDADIVRAAKQFDPARFRKLLTDPQTPIERLSLFAYLLGASGTSADADLLARLLRKDDDRTNRAFGGLLAGYTQLRSEDGWRLIQSMLGDRKEPAGKRLAALSTVRFFYRSHPDAVRPQAIKAMSNLIQHGDLADLAIEDLRLWREWGLTAEIVSKYPLKSHEAPLVRRAIVRYSLSCPRAEAMQLIEQLRKSDPQLVRDVEEALQFEQPKLTGRR